MSETVLSVNTSEYTLKNVDIPSTNFINDLCNEVMMRFFDNKTGIIKFESKRELGAFDVKEIIANIKLD